MDKLNGFDVFEDMLPGANTNENKFNTEDVSEELTDEELEQLTGKNKKVEESVKNDEEEEEEDEPLEEPKPVKTTRTSKVEEPEVSKEDDDTKDESVSAFFEALSEKMGWELGENDEIPNTPEELIDYFQSVIEENSVPNYASQEIEELDNFVRNGGDIRDYFLVPSSMELENIDLEDERNQKMLLHEYLAEKGLSAKQIEKKLTKYEDAGILEDEAEDALEALREIRDNKKQKLLQDQEKAARAAQKRQQDYFNSVVNEIKGMDNIRGVKIPEKDKKVLLEYIFKPTADGSTGFQKDWAKSVKNLIESAYFTMKGDTLMQAAKTEGSNAAINRFKNSLSRTGVSKRTKKQDNTSTDSMWGSFVRQFRAN